MAPTARTRQWLHCTVRNDAAKIEGMRAPISRYFRGSGCQFGDVCLAPFVRVGILIAFLTVLFTLLGPPFGILVTKKMEARKVPAVKVAPQELVDYSVSSSSGTTLSYFGYEFDVPWNANFKQKVGKGPRRSSI